VPLAGTAFSDERLHTAERRANQAAKEHRMPHPHQPAKLDGRRRFVPACAGALALIALVLALMGCDIEHPALPTFTTVLSIPIGEQRLDMADIAADEDYISVGLDSCLEFTVEGDCDSVFMDIDLAVEIAGESISSTFGNYELDLIEPQTMNFLLVDVLPDILPYVGMTIPVPPFDFVLESDPFILEDLQSAAITGGSVQLSLTNGLPVIMSGSEPPALMRISLLNAATGDTLATLLFPEAIAPGATAVVSAELGECTLSHEISVVMAGGSPGSDTPVLIADDAFLGVTAEIQNVTASEATLVLKPQTFTTEHVASWVDTLKILQADIADGLMDYAITSSLEIPAGVVLEWTDILDASGTPVRTALDLPPGGTVFGSLDFTSSRFLSPSGQPVAELALGVEVRLPGSDGAFVTLRATDGIEATIEPTLFHFASATGSIIEQVFPLDPTHEDVDLPDELSGVAITAAQVVVTVVNGLELPGLVDLTLSGTSASGAVESVSLSEMVAPASRDGFAETVVVLDESNSNVLDFINILPTSIDLTGKVTVGGDGVIGTVRQNNLATIDWRIEAPMELVIDDGIWRGDPERLDLSSDVRDLIRDHALGAEILTEVSNHLPFAVQVRLLVGDDAASVWTDPLLVIGPLPVSSGYIDPQLAYVTAPRLSFPTFALTAAEAQIFALPDLQLALEIWLPSTDGQTVRVRQSDHLIARGIVRLEIEVSE
jgi:hypothetical protein